METGQWLNYTAHNISCGFAVVPPYELSGIVQSIVK